MKYKGIDSGSAGPLRGGKTTTWEGGCRVPAIAWWPGKIAPGSVSSVVTGTIDVLPTAVSLSGGSVPAVPVIDGRNMSPVLFGNTTQSPRDAHYYFTGYELQAVRQGPWKLAIVPQPDAFGNGVAPDAAINPRLYHLKNDIGEQTNIAADNPDVVSRLQSLATAFNAEISGSGPTARRPAGRVANASTLFPFAVIPVPVVTGPAAQNVTARPMITWNSVPDAHSYDVWISRKAETSVYRRQTVSATSFTPSTDLDLGEYRVWVQGIFSDESRTGWSYARNFNVAPRPVVTGPTGLVVTSTPTITWSTVTGATRYDLWVNNVTTGQQQVVRNQNIAATQFKVGQPLPLGNYNAWVQAINSASFRGSWGYATRFTIATPPVLQTPINNLITNRQPAFSWTAVAGASRYDLWVRNLTTGEDHVVRESNLATTSFTPAQPLPPASYIWWVRALGDKGVSSKWPIGGRFSVSP
ncbi:MAG TPA: sulfatase-like hydrolase/transferase [Planctomycetaceae bacterium]|nr:sulfatase-like hydrolase/transferase [Planctomycetaceae bacterium]